MTEYTCQICDWDDAETVAALRSHVAAKKDEEHQEARREKAWNEWTTEDTQPIEGGKGGTEGGPTPSEKGGNDPSEGDDDEYPPSTPSETTEGEGAATPSDQGGSDPSEGGPDPSEEYEQQWTTENTQDEGGSEGGSDPSKGGSDPSGPEGNDIGAGAALVAGSVFVGLLVLLTRGEDGDEPIEVESEVEDVDDSDGGGFSTIQGGSEGASEGGSWG